MTERYPDEVLKRALNAYLPRKTEAEGIAAMRAVLEAHEHMVCSWCGHANSEHGNKYGCAVCPCSATPFAPC